MSSRATGRVIGTLFLAAFVVYIAGNALVGAEPGADVLPDVAAHPTRVAAGALLMLVNSVVVAAIGVLAVPVLGPHDRLAAHAYLVGRAVEATVLAVGVVFLLLLVPLARADVDSPWGAVLVRGNHYAYQIAMMSLGVVGVLFCRVLLRARLVPRFLAVWGLAGYAVFLAGAVLEVLGHGVGVALSVPGGLFEVALGVLLVARGFPERAVAEVDAAYAAGR
ncbi:DUF4386 domain-containing protein [Saccharothrix hoggarensis]|uniref:DUF4386 domain-containing protein n=1 Tax=Saccharothrix hoggarensis TaxID=913853 RepID=A0ABW3QQP2_9PSEU